VIRFAELLRELLLTLRRRDLRTSTAPRQFRLVLNSAMPWLTPAAKPVIFWTGRVMAKLTARTAVSALSAASTALSVIWSTFSICALT